MASVPALETPLNSPPNAPLISWRDGLTEKQAAFVDHYVRMYNATQAYKAAYNSEGAYATVAAEGRRVLADPRVQAAIKARQKIATETAGRDVGWLLERFARIGSADPRELIGLKVGCCRFCYGDGHLYQWREREYLEAVDKAEWESRTNPDTRLPDIAGGFGFNATLEPVEDCPQCHGEGVERFVPRDSDRFSDDAVLLYRGVKVTRDGYEIKMADQDKALELAGRIMGAFTDGLRVIGNVAHLHAVADLRGVDPQEAAKAYRAFIGGDG